MAAKLKKGDKVIVLTGKDKGKEGQISRVMPKQSQASQGGRVPTAMPIDLSNLALLDSNGKPTRVGFREEEGKKVRFAKTTGETV